MPHINIKLYPGKTDEEKKMLTQDIVKAVQANLQSKEASISVGFEEVSPEEWKEVVYEPEILGKAESLFKKPGYEM